MAGKHLLFDAHFAQRDSCLLSSYPTNTDFQGLVEDTSLFIISCGFIPICSYGFLWILYHMPGRVNHQTICIFYLDRLDTSRYQSILSNYPANSNYKWFPITGISSIGIVPSSFKARDSPVWDVFRAWFI